MVRFVSLPVSLTKISLATREMHYWEPDFAGTFNQYHYIFIISQLRLTSHPRSIVVVLDTGTPSTSKEIYNEDADDGT